MAETKPMSFKYTDVAKTFVDNIGTDNGFLVYQGSPAHTSIASVKYGALAANGILMAGGLAGIKLSDELIQLSVLSGEAGMTNAEFYTKAKIDDQYKIADIVEKSVANAGYLKSYEITRADGTKAYIDIPKDFFLKDAHVCVFTEKDATTWTDSVTETDYPKADLVAHGVKIGTPCFHFIINVSDNTANEKALFVPLDKLVPDAYTAGKGIGLTTDHEFYLEKSYTFTPDTVVVPNASENQKVTGVAVHEVNNANDSSTLVGYLWSAADMTKYGQALTAINATIPGNINDVSSRLKTAVERITAVETTANKAAADIVDLSTKVKANAAAITELQKVDTSVINKLVDVSNAVDNVVSGLNASFDDFDKVLLDISTRIANTSTAHDNSIADLDKRITAADSSITELKDARKVADGSIGTLITDVTNLKSRLNAADGSIGTLISDVSTLKTGKATADAKISALETSVGNLDASIKNTDASVTAVKTKISGIETSIGKLETSIGKLDSSVTTLIADVSTLKTSVTANTKSITDIQAAMTWVKI